MKSNFLLFAVLCVNLLVQAQELPEILKAEVYNRGVYRNFAEFLKNSPSVTNQFKITTKANDEEIQNGKAIYRLTVADSTTIGKNIWGFCDGKVIYVNEANYGQQYGFRRLLRVSRYCVHQGFFTREVRAAAMLPGGGLASVGVPIRSTEPYILNINNGKFYLLSKGTMRAILKKDEGLLRAYESESGKGGDDMLFRYIDSYNRKYLNEATTLAEHPIKVVLLRRDKQERNEVLNIMFSDSSKVELKPNSLFQFERLESVVKICVNGSCYDLALSKKQVNYFQCSWNVKTKAPSIEKMDRQAGEFYTSKIEGSIK
jgi:hypothetical protein